MNRSFPLLVSAGEPSGDRAAARVVAALVDEGVNRFFGIGGTLMEARGVELISNIASMAALGIADSLRNLGRWANAWIALRERVIVDRPAAALLVDAPEFHLPLARVLSSSGIPVIWYIGPQIWAWRQDRLLLLKERTDAVALILPFEKPFYDKAGVCAEFVGHPLLDESPPKQRDTVRQSLGISSETRMIALLPGSRPAEISRHLSILTAVAQLLVKKGVTPIIAPGGAFAFAHRSAADRNLFLPPSLTARDLLSASDAALTASGTVTLEAALLGVPQATFYRTDPVSYLIGKHLLSLPYISLPNWILGQKVFPEILQYNVTKENLLWEAMRLLDPNVAASQREYLQKITSLMGGPGSCSKVAAMVLNYLK
jgi:lipid-A-disaccharide synthase